MLPFHLSKLVNRQCCGNCQLGTYCLSTVKDHKAAPGHSAGTLLSLQPCHCNRLEGAFSALAISPATANQLLLLLEHETYLLS